MTVKVIALVTINEDRPMALAKYLELTTPVLDRVGARIVERYQLETDVVGDCPARTVIIVDYPTREAVETVLTSDEYEAAKPYRDMAFSDYMVSVV